MTTDINPVHQIAQHIAYSTSGREVLVGICCWEVRWDWDLGWKAKVIANNKSFSVQKILYVNSDSGTEEGAVRQMLLVTDALIMILEEVGIYSGILRHGENSNNILYYRITSSREITENDLNYLMTEGCL
jgi:hypothetical protein